MVHPCKQVLDGVDDNNIGCLTPQGNGAGIEVTILFHGIDGSVDGGDNNLSYLTHEVDCCLKARKE
eukprot:4814791-Ditylum_brightwellii.AAC.1